ncbi:MAG: CRISPR-associated endonuclease Cas1 [Hydrogenobacter thermophilus]|nr:MAG: CRISPR-associated endonuclease Cas1 [Hydrogenobacter thermophilus]
MGKPYFLIKDGKLSRKENTILFESKDITKTIPIEDVDELFVISDVSLTSKLLKLLAKFLIIRVELKHKIIGQRKNNANILLWV